MKKEKRGAGEASPSPPSSPPPSPCQSGAGGGEGGRGGVMEGGRDGKCELPGRSFALFLSFFFFSFFFSLLFFFFWPFSGSRSGSKRTGFARRASFLHRRRSVANPQRRPEFLGQEYLRFPNDLPQKRRAGTNVFASR